MFVTDASVWVSRYLPDDTNHEASARWLHRMLERQTTMLSPSILLPELTGPISRSASEFEARRVLSQIGRLMAVRLVPVDDELASLAARLAARYRLRGADAIYVALADSLAIPLVTRDGEQRERECASISVRSPAQLMNGE